MNFYLRSLPAAVLFLILGTVPIYGASKQSHGRISGNITSTSGSPLRDAFVNIFKVAEKEQILADASLRSNRSGFFRSTHLAPGTYYLQISREGYRSVATSSFEVKPNRTTSLDITLPDLIQFLSKEDDPRNWDLKTVMRSSSDRRMIFRNLPASISDTETTKEAPFSRNGTMSVASNASLGSHLSPARPQTSQNGVLTNFAFVEPLSRRSRMIFSGQFDYGRNSIWRVWDTFHYRPDNAHDYKVTLGYGRMHLNYPGEELESQFPSTETGPQESGLQTLAFGVEGNSKIFDLLAVNYRFDYSHLRYKTNRSFVHPSLKIVLTPLDGWRFTTSFASRRESDKNSVMLSSGEVLNLSDPTLITVIGDNVSMSQVRHSEIAVEKTFTPATTLEVALYRDDIYGPGIPFMVTAITSEEHTSTILNLNEDRSRQQGMRITLNRRMFTHLKGSFAYGYGEATGISDIDGSLSIDSPNGDFLEYAQQQYHHSITGQLDASIPDTYTNLLVTLHWYPGNPISPIDWFSDSMDIGSKSLNFKIRQSIPMQSFLINPSRLEFLLDLRNIFNQGEEVLQASDGILVLSRNPRSLRFGLNLNFN